MPAAARLLAAFLLLIAAFCVLVGVAVFSLAAAGEGQLAVVVAGAGLAGLFAGGVTYWLLRRDGMAEEPVLQVEPLVPIEPEPPRAVQRVPVARRPLRVQAMPVANLPPAYVDAVLRGAQARLDALKVQSRQQELH